MKICIFEDHTYANLYPLTYLRPVFELKCGHTSLLEKIVRAYPGSDVCYFIRDCLVPTFSKKVGDGAVNKMKALADDDLLIINGRTLFVDYEIEVGGAEEVGLQGEHIVYARVKKVTVEKCYADNFCKFLENIKSAVPQTDTNAPLISYPWNLVEHNGEAIASDFAYIGKSGVDGNAKFSDHAAIWGAEDQIYIAPGAEVQPFVALDTTGGPIIIDEGVVVNPHTRIEGPASIGKDTMIVGGKIREDTSIGPVCRVGGEVEASIIHGYSNKYHDGFLGHAYICEWVNIGALTTNSDLKNDYTTVVVHINGKDMDSGSTKAGCFIGDHTKTSIGTYFNTGTVVGVMSNIVGGGLLPKFIPSFIMFMNNKVFKAGLKGLLGTARTAMRRRSKELTDEDVDLIKQVYDLTKEERNELIKKSRRALAVERGLKGD